MSSSLRVLIPGFYTSVTKFHYDMARFLQAHLSSHMSIPISTIEINLLIIPKHYSNIETDYAFLKGIPYFNNIIINKDHVISKDFLKNESVNLVIEFEGFPLQFDDKIECISSDSKINLSLSCLHFDSIHPDIKASSALFYERYSPRLFSTERIDPDIIKNAVEIARRAPSAGNLQAYKYILVLNRDLMKKLQGVAYNQELVSKCAGLFVVVSDPNVSSAKYGKRGADFYSVVDATIACTHLQLALQQFDVYSRWVGAYNNQDILDVMGIERGTVTGLLPFGHPEQDIRVSHRKETEAVFQIIE